MTDGAQPGLPRRDEPGLAELAAFTVDHRGLVTSWPSSAARLFGQSATEAAGRDVSDVLLTSPGQHELVRQALAEVAAGRVWAATVAGGRLGDGRFAIRWEPMDGSGEKPGALVIVERAWPPARPAWLSEAAGGIGDSLDLDRTTAEILGITVPAFADAANVYIAEYLLAADDTESPWTSRRTAVRRLGSRFAGEAAAVGARLMPPGEVFVFDQGTPGFRAMTTGQPITFGQLDEQTTQRVGRHPGGSEFLANYGSFLAMPLATRGTEVGCMMFARTMSSPAFGESDLPHAGEFAARAAAGIDNARLYHKERRMAQALQHGLLPPEPDAPPGLEIASRYVPVGSNIVGGDWHDVIALPGGRAALVIGDAMGHGPEAAAAMVQLRTAARVLADQQLPPRQVLRGLDRIIATFGAAPFATCVCSMIDPTGSCLSSRAGHPPPVLVLPAGAAKLLDLPPGLPLGLGEEAFEETLTSLPVGATLALYTDGLVESRIRPIDEGLADLCTALTDALSDPLATLDAVCETVITRLAMNGGDDITLVLARIRP
ncbi:MAG: SpoIIE family protein phosphatase [Streptosporangiaceae bacterium]|jgi:GAF domain-containing protein